MRRRCPPSAAGGFVAEDPGAEGFAVLSKRGITVVDSNLFGVPGRKRLASMALPEPVSQSG